MFINIDLRVIQNDQHMTEFKYNNFYIDYLKTNIKIGKD
jgi:hypothetical protein